MGSNQGKGLVRAQGQDRHAQADRGAPVSGRADRLLGLLSEVHPTGKGVWRARCPVHGGRSLVIREINDRVLLKCWGGCGAIDVLGAIGLDWSALFPPGDAAPVREKIAARTVLESVAHEIDVVWFLITDLREQGQLDQAQWERLTQAAHRIGEAREYVGR